MNSLVEDRQRIVMALAVIPADVEREEWWRIGAAVKHGLGDEGFELFDRWSQGGESYVATDARATWRSLKTEGSITVASLFAKAKAFGFDASTHKSQALDSAEVDRLRQVRRTRAEKHEKERMLAANKAVTNALVLWTKSTPAANDHPYLLKKGIVAPKSLHEMPADKLARLLGYEPEASGEKLTGRILIAQVKIGILATSVEMIDENGRKSALYGGTKSGGYWIAAMPKDPTCILIAEGVATAISAFTCTGYAVVAALTCGNMPRTAEALRKSYPRAQIVLLGDLGAGLEKAREAARLVGGLVAMPDFGDDRPDGSTDFNDLHQARGADAVAEQIAAVLASGSNAVILPDQPSEPVDEPKTAAKQPKKSIADQFAVRLVNASDIKPEAVNWIWVYWLPAGKLTILAGNPGSGKTTLAIAIAATITIAGRWPDGTHCPAAGNVLVWSAEDDPADTLVPRLMAAGADLTRVKFIQGVHLEGESIPFDPSRDIPLLDRGVADMGGVSLLIIDPIVSAVAGDMHKANDVRRSLQAVVDFASRHGCAVLGISHFNKGGAGSNPLERVTGSQAFGALARLVWVAAKDENTDSRVLARAKSNIGPDDGGIAYHLDVTSTVDGIEASRVMWGDTIEGSAREILGTVDADVEDPPDESANLSQFERARCFLYDLLTPFASTREIQAAAKAEGISWTSMERAKKAEIAEGRRIVAKKSGNGWGWLLEDYEAPASPVGTDSLDTRSVDGLDGLAAKPCPVRDSEENSRPSSENVDGLEKHPLEPYPAGVAAKTVKTVKPTGTREEPPADPDVTDVDFREM